MLKKLLTITAIALLASLSMAKAQVLTAGTTALNGSTIINDGYLAYAYNLDYAGAGATTTLNGVTLTGIDIFPTNPSSDFTITGTGGYDGTGNGTSPSDAIYTLEKNGAYFNLTLTLKNLTPGYLYQAQLLITEQNGDSRVQQYVDTANGAASPVINAITGPQYILDTFKATGTTETLQAQYGGGTGAQLAGFVVEAVPEPGTWAMLGFGLVGLAAFGVRRRMVARS